MLLNKSHIFIEGPPKSIVPNNFQIGPEVSDRKNFEAFPFDCRSKKIGV